MGLGGGSSTIGSRGYLGGPRERPEIRTGLAELFILFILSMMLYCVVHKRSAPLSFSDLLCRSHIKDGWDTLIDTLLFLSFSVSISVI